MLMDCFSSGFPNWTRIVCRETFRLKQFGISELSSIYFTDLSQFGISELASTYYV